MVAVPTGQKENPLSSLCSKFTNCINLLSFEITCPQNYVAEKTGNGSEAFQSWDNSKPAETKYPLVAVQQLL